MKDIPSILTNAAVNAVMGMDIKGKEKVILILGMGAFGILHDAIENKYSFSIALSKEGKCEVNFIPYTKLES